MPPQRRDNGVIGRWWWTIDRYTLAAIFTLMAIGAVLVSAASPAVAERINLDPFHFVERQLVFLGLAAAALIGVSFLNIIQLQRISLLGFCGSIFLLMLLPLVGDETKGAVRWVSIAGVTIQPSEFLKPFFAIGIAWLFAVRQQIPDFPAYRAAAGVLMLVVFLLLIQPDFGMTITFCAIWGVQLFLAGLPFIWIAAFIIIALLGGFGAYHFFPHVKERFDRFLDPSSGDNYQVDKSIQAFQNGGIIGKGPGEGVVKQYLPDSHTDFIFAVAGEEFGMLFCLLIVMLFAFIIVRGLMRVWQQQDFFSVLAVAGLLTQFGVQALINMGVSLQMLPAKGMTLPFLSYGGSSVMAVAITMGMVIALTRKRYGRKLKRSG
jgi:cell division protein FtsW